MECRVAVHLVGLFLSVSLLLLCSLPSPSEAQTESITTTVAVPSTSPPIPLLENLQAELIPDNNTIVRQLPAQFYCRITDTTGEISDIPTQWYINNVIYTNPEVIELIALNVSSGTQTNLTVISSVFETFIVVSCRTSFYPSASLARYQIEIPPVTVRFDQMSVNSSEGNVAVVCARAFFTTEIPGQQRVFVNVSHISGGSASVDDFSPESPLPITLELDISSEPMCVRIFIVNDSIAEGEESFTLELTVNSQRTEPGIVNIPPTQSRAVVNIRETCYNGEIRLRGGYNVNQGRVEICFNGVWGTVCDDGNGWTDGGTINARVVCRQLGLPSTSSVAFESALFGPGSYAMPIHLDNVICGGSETSLQSCSHNGIGISNCEHREDVSVDCQGSSPVGAPCTSTGDIQLVGGIDASQGRVEVCTESGVYSTVCSIGWDTVDAQVVCGQLGFESSLAVATPQFREAVFGLGVGSIQISDVNCIGNETNLLNCSRQPRSCIHLSDAGVDCLGRPLPDPPTINFEMAGGSNVFIREGESLELCVVLQASRIPFEFLFPVQIRLLVERVTVTNATLDFTIDTPLGMEDSSTSEFELFLGPTITRTCFTINAIDDSIPEDMTTPYAFQLVSNVENQQYQVSNQALIQVTILDDDFICEGGGRRCIDIESTSASCIPALNVCDGMPQCSDGSDETNCPNYCQEAQMDGFNCLPEGLCLPQEYECDGVPDCVTGLAALDEMDCNVECISGTVHEFLIGGATDSEGMVEVCVGGVYYPVSANNGGFSVREASVICRELSLGNAGIPISGADTFFSSSSQRVQVSCQGTESLLSSCNINLVPLQFSPALVRCFEQTGPSCEDGATRLADGPNPNEGRVEICYQNVWGAVYDQDWTGNDTAVLCSQLGFGRLGATPVIGVSYGSTTNVPISITSPDCIGGEVSLLDCPTASTERIRGTNAPLGETNRYQNERDVMENIVGARCEVYPAGACTYLDTRLTFRSANSTGLLEVCNEMGEWSLVCGDGGISPNDARVICSQLGRVNSFNSPYQTTVEINPFLYGGIDRPVSTIFNGNGFGCLGSESNLIECAGALPTPDPGGPGLRRKRVAGVCSVQAVIGCNAPPRVYFKPPSVDGIYEVDVGRRFGLSCLWDRNIFPQPSLFTNSRASQRSKRQSTPTVIPLLSFDPVTAMESDEYTCSGLYGAEQSFRENVTVRVRGPTGINQSTFIRLSTLTFSRFNTQGEDFSSTPQQFANSIADFVFNLIPAEVPGVHIVDYCTYVNRTLDDAQRRLDRIECKVTQYADIGEMVMPVAQVLEWVTFQLTRTFSIFVDPIQISDTGFCDAEAIISISGTTFEWRETSGGSSDTFVCPLNVDFNTTRMCDVGGVWLSFDETACGVVLGELNRLNDSFSNLTEGTYGAAVASLSQIVSQTENDTVEQNSEVLNSVADYFTELSVFVLDSNVTINNTVVDNVVAVVSSLLQWQPANVQVASSSSVVESFEVVVSIYAQQLPLNENQTFTMPSLTLYAELRSVQTLNQTGRSFTIGDNQDPVLAPADQVMPGQLLPQQDAAINLPGTLFGMIGDRTNVGVFFALYNSSVLFPVNGGRDINSNNPVQREVGSRVLAATVGPGINFQNLQDPVIIVLRLQTSEGRYMRAGSEMCVTWDFTINDWSTEGCSLNATSSDGIVTCTCNHLTNFAVLVDICLRQEDCAPSQVDDALTFISYIGMSISIVSLVITIITLLLFKKVRQKDTSKYHIQLSLAILLMLIVAFVLVVLSAENVTPLYGGCVTVSVLVHYFTLVAVMWMGAEALLMFQKLVIVFSRVTTKFIVIVSIVCWTAPIPLVAIPLIVDLANGNDIGSDIIVRRANSTNTQDISFCFLSHIGALWGAFLAPIFAVLIFNIVIFIWVIVILVRHTKGTAARKKEAVGNKTIFRLMISIAGVMSLFGLTWLFAILTFSVPGLRETFQILFVIFNSFQGFFIFLFICIFNKEVLESWKEYLSCGKYKSTLLHPSQAKYSTGTSTGARKGKKTSNTGTTGFGSSSTGEKHVSEVSKSDYNSSTLVKEKEFESQAEAETTPLKAKEEFDGTPEPAIVLTEADVEESQQNGNTGQEEDGDKKEGGSKEKKKKTLSLKARIKRYSTKKVSKHHVEEIEVDFKSDDSDDSSSGEEATDIV